MKRILRIVVALILTAAANTAFSVYALGWP